eukprot:CAMPEP_0174850348 /NCGR_PEP_ID=MMETSP1114-20130205/19178_1 /TAXON_ID=312471 /ORGANISM="Neobodo designis, Strain CCAP 1951/1" /LENGTH=378 /DNA_ID=CAMNT_0016084803 /DNA_START=117 /DNA_END=1253 /DNA_ORIENTATION=-
MRTARSLFFFVAALATLPVASATGTDHPCPVAPAGFTTDLVDTNSSSVETPRFDVLFTSTAAAVSPNVWLRLADLACIPRGALIIAFSAPHRRLATAIIDCTRVPNGGDVACDAAERLRYVAYLASVRALSGVGIAAILPPSAVPAAPSPAPTTTADDGGKDNTTLVIAFVAACIAVLALAVVGIVLASVVKRRWFSSRRRRAQTRDAIDAGDERPFATARSNTITPQDSPQRTPPTRGLSPGTVATWFLTTPAQPTNAPAVDVPDDERISDVGMATVTIDLTAVRNSDSCATTPHPPSNTTTLEAHPADVLTPRERDTDDDDEVAHARVDIELDCESPAAVVSPRHSPQPEEPPQAGHVFVEGPSCDTDACGSDMIA